MFSKPRSFNEEKPKALCLIYVKKYSARIWPTFGKYALYFGSSLYSIAKPLSRELLSGQPSCKGYRQPSSRVYKEPVATNGQPFCNTFEDLKIQNKNLRSNWWFKNHQLSSPNFSLLQTHISNVAHFNLMRQFLLPFINKCSEISIFVFCVNNI